MRDNFIALDNENKVTYENNFVSFVKKSDKIKSEFLSENQNKEISHFVIFHDAYNYLFNEFGIDPDYAIVLEDTAGREPSVSDMKENLDIIALNNIKYLYKEPQFDSKLIDMLQEQQYNLEVDILDPLGQWVDKNSYFDNIEENLNNLKKIYE